MPVISGGGGGGNTTAQVAASGKVVPVAAPTGVTVDSTTYNNPLGAGKLWTLVFPANADNAVSSWAQAGDAFPREIVSSDPSDWASYYGNGSFDPTASGARFAYDSAGGSVGLAVASYVRTTLPCTAANQLPQLAQVSPKFSVTSGALNTFQLVSGTGTQVDTGRDSETITPCTFNPGAATTATVTVALSPDNVTYSTLGVETEPAGVAFDGTIHLVKVRVPAGWYLKLTVNAQAVLGLTTSY